MNVDLRGLYLPFQQISRDQQRVPDRAEGWGVGQVQPGDLLQGHFIEQGHSQGVDLSGLAVPADPVAAQEATGILIGYDL